MRVTNRASTRNYLRYVNKGLSDQAKVQEKVASGNRFEKVSDDVSSGIKAMKAKSDQYKMEKQIGNIEDINNVLVAAEDSMQSIDDQLKTVHERFLRAMNDTNKNNRTIFATELKALKEEILQLANSQYNGQFLFSGSNNYGAPFSVDKETGHLVYNGVGVPADQIFRREDGTYYYKTVQYDKDGNAIEKVVPKKENGDYVLEKDTPKFQSTASIFAAGAAGTGTITPNGGTAITVTQDPGSASFYKDAANNTYYVDTNTAYQLETTALNFTPDTPGVTTSGKLTIDGADVPVTQKTGTTDPVIYVKNPSDGNEYVTYTDGSVYHLAATDITPNKEFSSNTDAAGKITINVVTDQGTDQVAVTQQGTSDIYEAADGTLYKKATGTNFFRVENEKDKDGNVIKTDLTAYRDVPLNEDIYLDVGLGIRMTGSTVDPQTAFNVSYAGPDILGFGVDEETGLSNNIYNLLNDMEKMLANADEYSTEQAQEFGRHLLDRLDAFRENVTDLGAKTQFLETMLDRLNKSRDNLEISIGNYTGTDYVEESRHQASASAVVNALYQLGSNIIPLSLMDFVK